MKNAAIDRRGIFFWLRERKPGLLRLSFEAVLFKRFWQLFRRLIRYPCQYTSAACRFRELFERANFERANVEHELHFVDASDALCKRQLKERSKDLSAGIPWTTHAEFEAITVYFSASIRG